MGRPNISLQKTLDFISQRDGAWVNTTTLLQTLGFSEPIVRECLKRLLESGQIEVDRNQRPFNYRAVN